MSFTRRIGEYRSTVILAVLVVLSLVSLASGARGGPIASSLHTVVGIVSLPFLTALNTVEDGVLNATNLFTQYHALRDEKQGLERSYAVLLQHAADRQELAAENKRLRTLIDFKRREPRLTLEPVEVISRVDGTLTIDRGTLHGMRPSMCVISPRGVVGMITQTDPFTSYVATLQSPECKVDAMIKRNRVRGTVSGTGNDLNRICSMRYIDLKDDVEPGDIVVTSPDSVFPSGLPVGRIVRVNDVGSLLQAADVEPAANPFHLDEVFVVRSWDLRSEELAGADLARANEENQVNLLDTESIQERFAP